MIEKMEFISITGPKADIDRVVDQYLSRYEIHLENALAELNTVQNLSPYLQINPYKPLLSRAEELEALLEPRDTEEAASISLEDAAALVEELDQKLSGLDADKKSLDEQLHRTEELLQKLEPFGHLEYDISTLLNFRFVYCQFGKIPKEYYSKFETYVYDNMDTLFIAAMRMIIISGVFISARGHRRTASALYTPPCTLSRWIFPRSCGDFRSRYAEN